MPNVNKATRTMQLMAKYCRLRGIPMIGSAAHLVLAADGVSLSRRAAIEYIENAVSGQKIPPKKRLKPTGFLAAKTVESQVVTVANPVYEQLGFPSYKAYLQSDLWASIRKRVFERDGNCCILCQKDATEAHHRSYDRDTMMGKDISLIISICSSCHHDLEYTPDGSKNSLDEAERKLKNIFDYGRCEPPKKPSLQDISFTEVEDEFSGLVKLTKPKNAVLVNSEFLLEMIREIRLTRRR